MQSPTAASIALAPSLPARRLDIVVVDDEAPQRDILVAGLAHFGHRVRGAADGAELDARLDERPADVVVLDVGLPGEDGYALAARLRQRWSGGIVMATGRGRVDERIRGLDAGADAYLVKPIDLRELAATLDSLARRLPGPPAACWHFERGTSTLLTPAGIAISLTARESILLQQLVAHPGEDVGRDRLFRTLSYPDNRHGDLRLEALVSRLRAKVRAAAPHTPLPLFARQNRGYAFLAGEAEGGGCG